MEKDYASIDLTKIKCYASLEEHSKATQSPEEASGATPGWSLPTP